MVRGRRRDPPLLWLHPCSLLNQRTIVHRSSTTQCRPHRLLLLNRCSPGKAHSGCDLPGLPLHPRCLPRAVRGPENPIWRSHRQRRQPIKQSGLAPAQPNWVGGVPSPPTSPISKADKNRATHLFQLTTFRAITEMKRGPVPSHRRLGSPRGADQCSLADTRWGGGAEPTGHP